MNNNKSGKFHPNIVGNSKRHLLRFHGWKVKRWRQCGQPSTLNSESGSRVPVRWSLAPSSRQTKPSHNLLPTTYASWTWQKEDVILPESRPQPRNWACVLQNTMSICKLQKESPNSKGWNKISSLRVRWETCLWMITRPTGRWHDLVVMKTNFRDHSQYSPHTGL